MDFEHALPARPTVHPSSAVKNCVLGAYTEIGPGCALEETRLGDYSYCFAQNDIIYSDIGKFCSIATGVRLNPAPHPSSLRPAQHHFTYRCTKYGFGPDDDSVVAWRREQRVVIGNDVWLGHNAVIMGGVTIGDGAVVGAGAVVTHDVAPTTLSRGSPRGACGGGSTGRRPPRSGASAGGTGPTSCCASGSRISAQSRDSAKNTIRSEQDRNEHHLQKARIDRFELLDGQGVFPAADLDREGGPVQAVDEPVLETAVGSGPLGGSELVAGRGRQHLCHQLGAHRRVRP